MEELSDVLTQYFVSCVHVRFYFSLPLIFTLLAASLSPGLSHCLTAALNFHVIRLFCFQSLALALSLLSTWNRQKYRRKKTLFLLFFSF